MTTAFFIALFVFGLAIGSFMNVLVWRYDPQGKLFDVKRLSGRSRCPYCNHELKASELVPLWSFFVQGGRCRECGHGLSFRYPIVEFLGGAIFAGLPLFLNGFYGVNNSFFASFGLEWWYYAVVLVWIAVFLTLLAIAVIDLRDYVIPNELNVLLGVLGALAAVLILVYGDKVLPFRDSFLEQYRLIFSPFQGIILNRLLGLLAGGLFFGLLVFASRGRGMGMGDVKMALAAGLALGWPDIALATMISFLLGGLIGGILLIFGKKQMKDKLPFAPFFVLAIFITVFFGSGIVSGYFSLFGI
jgi:prepilin signal peptidase PulO-like enzyme (type II secretory pathway)